jgi:predicted ATPase/class 3 adenylate cyclase
VAFRSACALQCRWLKEAAEQMTVPPTGTVTFLFTDIEGSTKMWERDAATMQAALARHDEILRSAIEANGGYVFKTVGDAFCAAFPAAPYALDAALDAQRALCDEPWDEGSAIKARIALHTGTVEERDGDYFGPPVNRVARLLSIANGGQVLLSTSTQELVRDELPSGSGLRDLGEHRLKDLSRPERVFQLAAPGLTSEFPALRTLESHPNNLPIQPTPLVGRDREVAEIADRVRSEEARLLTLTGPGGTGKTRLALQAAADLLEEFEDGVFFVALATITDPELVASTVAGPLGVKESGDRPLKEGLEAYLRDRNLLLVLDNFEQILEGASLVGELLGACPKLKVLATSRIPLRLYGEQEYPVPPLAVPNPGVLPPLEVLTQYEAVRLFVERARSVKPDFEITNESAPAVAKICARLDGLPLAIELAAARVKILPPEAMLGRIANRLKLLKGGARDLPARQRTLRGAIDWSHDLLGEEERTLFRRLSVFAGGRTIEAIEEICDPEGELDALEGVESMVDKSLIRQEEADGEPRFVMLETIHEYAREKLEESGEAEEIKRLHADYFLTLAEGAEPELVGPDQVAWLDRLETEHDNMRSALSWALGSGRIETALRLGGALGWFWRVHGHFVEGGRWLEEALSADEGVPDLVRAKALCSAGYLAHMQGDFERARRLLQESLALYRELGDEEGTARSLHHLGYIDHYGDIERARRLLEESLEINRRVGNKRELAMVLHALASMTADTGEQERTKALFEESEALFRESGDIQGLSGSLALQGWAALVEGDTGRARKLAAEGLELSREIRDKDLESWQQSNLGLVALEEGDTGRAWMLLVESLEGYLEAESRVGVIDSLVDVGAVAGARGEPLRAARLWGAADALREVTGYTMSVREAGVYEPYMSAARSELGETAFRAAWDEGRAMTEEQAIALALKNEESNANLGEIEPV